MLVMNAGTELRTLLPSGRSARHQGASPVTQVSVRLPAELHERARAAAAKAGLSLTALVERGLTAEIAKVEDPAAQFADQVSASIRRRVAAALADGTWDEMVASSVAGDPDLAS
jgi:predicted DNA-binding protein